jgi:hypothetical protein
MVDGLLVFPVLGKGTGCGLFEGKVKDTWAGVGKPV